MQNGKSGKTIKMFNSIYTGKRVIVTGHTGFKGAWLSLWLRLMDADVYGISNGIPTDPSLFEVAGIESQLTHYKEDIRDLQAMKRIFKDVKPNYVFHLAAQPI